LHDWDANFDFVKAQNGNFSFQFRVHLRANPDIKLDYSQSDRPTFGRAWHLLIPAVPHRAIAACRGVAPRLSWPPHDGNDQVNGGLGLADVERVARGHGAGAT
jgi:hypothetical protein